MRQAIEHRSLFIKDLIRKVQTELIESQRERETAGEEPIFQINHLTIEVNFVVTESKDAHGDFDFKVITAGGSKTIDQQQVHKITLSLKAVPTGGLGTLRDLEGEGPTFRPRMD